MHKKLSINNKLSIILIALIAALCCTWFMFSKSFASDFSISNEKSLCTENGININENKPVAVVNKDDSTIKLYYDSESHEGEGDVYGFEDEKWRNGYYRGFYDCSLLISENFRNYPIQNASYMFSYVVFVEGLYNINASELTSTQSMFSNINCPSLDLYLNNYDFGKVENMQSMFWGGKLKSLSLESLSLSKVKNMKCMFENFTVTSGINLKNVYTGKVENMEEMFMGCNTPILDFANWDTSSVRNMKAMFKSLKGISVLDLSSFETIDVEMKDNYTEQGSGMFNESSVETIILPENFGLGTKSFFALFNNLANLKNINTENINSTTVTDFSWMFRDCISLESVNLSCLDTRNGENMHGMFKGCSSLASLDLNSFSTSEVTNMGSMFSGCKSVSTILMKNFNTSKVTNMSSMFGGRRMEPDGGCQSLKSLDLSHFNTKNVKDMSFMFDDCSTLSTLIISNFNTHEVTNMCAMFRDCSSLVSVDLKSFDTINVDTMSSMFERCSKLEQLDLSNFNTSNVIYMGGMFCFAWFTDSATFMDSSLRKIILSQKFDTSNVEDMSYMFAGCFSLQEVDVSNFNTGKVKSMEGMFRCFGNAYGVLNLSNFNTSNVEDMSYMFEDYGRPGPSSIYREKEIIGLNFNTSNVISMRYMFANQFSITSLDLSNFNIDSQCDLVRMFFKAERLVTIYVKNDSVWTNSKSQSIFYECYKILGGNGTTYKSAEIDYARVDGLDGLPGYFSEKPVPPERERAYASAYDDSWSFGNWADKIDKDWYKLALWNMPESQIEQLYKNEEQEKHGLCFGHNYSALQSIVYNRPPANTYHTGERYAQYLNDVEKNWISEQTSRLAWQQIELCWIYQLYPSLNKPLHDNAGWSSDCAKTLKTIYNQIDNCLWGTINSPIIIAIGNNDTGHWMQWGDMEKHALWPIGIGTDDEDTTEIIIVDSNCPNEESYMWLEKYNGEFISWTYIMSDGSTWSSKNDGSFISWIPIEKSVGQESNEIFYDDLITTDADECIVESDGEEYCLSLNSEIDVNKVLPISVLDDNEDNIYNQFWVNLDSRKTFKNFTEDSEIRVSDSLGGLYVQAPTESIVQTDFQENNTTVIIDKDGTFTTCATFISDSSENNLEEIDVSGSGQSTVTLSLSKTGNYVDFNGLTSVYAVKGAKSIEASGLNPINKYTIVEEENELKIYLSINDTTVDPISPQTFTGSQIKPSITVKMGEETLNENQDYTLSYENNINVGTATVSITGIGDYAGTKEVDFSIVPKNIIVKADNKIKQYGDADPQFTGICYEEDEQTVVINPPIVTFSRELGEDLGTYDIYASTTDTNYNITKITGTLTIEQKDIKIIANNISKTFGDDDPEITGNVTDTEDNPISNPPVINYSRDDGENVGDYDIKATTDNNNFNIVDVSGTFSILTKKIAKPRVLQIRYTGTEQCAIEESYWYTITDINGIYPGDYQSNVSLNDIDNTSWWDDSVVDKVIDWTISKAILMASYAGEEIKFGVNPKLDISVSGFVNGETEKTATGYVAPEIDKPTTLEPGEYTLTPYGGEADNYEFNYVSGTLKVVPENTPTGDITDSSKTGDVTPLTVLLIVSFVSIMLFISVRCNRRFDAQHLR